MPFKPIFQSKNQNVRILSIKNKPTILEQAFDLLSSIPLLRKVMHVLWVFSTVFFGFSILVEGLAIVNGKAPFRSEWVKNLLMWSLINPMFAHVFHLWKKREGAKIV